MDTFETYFNIVPIFVFCGAVFLFFILYPSLLRGFRGPGSLATVLFPMAMLLIAVFIPLKEIISVNTSLNEINIKKYYLLFWPLNKKIKFGEISAFAVESKGAVRPFYRGIVFRLKNNQVYDLNSNKLIDYNSLYEILNSKLVFANNVCEQKLLNWCV